MIKTVGVLLGALLLCNGAFAEEPNPQMISLESKVYWYTPGVNLGFYYNVCNKDGEAYEIFQSCLGEQPWSVADIIKCCMENYNQSDNVDKCTELIEFAIDQHNKYISNNITQNVASLDRDTPIKWDGVSIASALRAVYGSTEKLPDLIERISAINSDYIMTVDDLELACKDVFNEITGEPTCSKFVESVIET